VSAPYEIPSIDDEGHPLPLPVPVLPEGPEMPDTEPVEVHYVRDADYGGAADGEVT
jgi:hypothetical protein